MRAKTVAVVVVSFVVARVANADEWLPDWMQPGIAPQSNLEVVGALLIRPDDDFGGMARSPFGADSGAIPAAPTGRVNLATQTSFDQALVRSKIDAPDYRELREIPGLSREWKAEQLVSVPLPADQSLFMFGQFNSGGDADQTTSHVKTRTGLGLKFSPFMGSELQLRSGPVVIYDDAAPSRPVERSQLSVELQAKVGLFGPLQLEYASEALPALAQTDRNTLLHDLKIALPLGINREISIGARYRWDDAQTTTSWTQRAEMYMGFKFER
jgi:hypothetical protein